MNCVSGRLELQGKRDTAIRFLVEAALQSVATKKQASVPRSREEWVDRLCTEIMSDSETSHRNVISSLIATGVTTEQVLQIYVPAVAQRIGELWIQDRASFVQVTVGASRLQALFQNEHQPPQGKWLDRTVPLGQSMLMILPESEDHTLGAFVAADQFRRHGIWVRMAIRLKPHELVRVIEEGCFSMLGMSLATQKSIAGVEELINFLRSAMDHCPPIVIGGRYVLDKDDVEERTGADFAVRSVREAIERCGLASVSEPLSFDSVV
ncbi:cobalamin B12-binding domain-containing protein [Primorskyibacter sp. 2E107]|uniref:cobalamin B12-binding domain-containing protein n=1 Tax=Primorskyibacter sp. 2E107 TaxID=3403458 RepID=UPI003AF92B67